MQRALCPRLGTARWHPGAGSIRRRTSALVAVVAAVCLTASPVTAQVCGLAGRPDFAGHQMPLDSPLLPSSYTTVDAFPNLTSFSMPIFLTSAGDGSGRVFVAEQGGRIFAFPGVASVTNGQRSLYLDLSGVVACCGEGGLLGLAFDPDYANNGVLYVDYTVDEPGGCQSPTCFKVVVERITVPDPQASTVVLGSTVRQRLVEIVQFATNHNGGMIAFGPDGGLYVGVGDGGGGGDPDETGQDPSDLLGSILRLDPTDGSAAAGNPDLGPGADPRVYHYGLRNPWRFSFDRDAPFDLWIGDVGQDQREEIDRAPAGVGGLNFGWDDCEGTRDFEGLCATPGHEPPVIEIDHTQGQSITGGYVYRGAGVPSLYGHYVFADFASGAIWSWDRVSIDPSSGLADIVPLTNAGSVSSFGEDEAGELYVVTYGGRIRRFVESGGGGGPFPALLSGTGFFTDTASLSPAPGMIPYDVASALWSDRAAKWRWVAPVSGSKIAFDPRAALDLPVGTAFVKHFELPVAGGALRRLETRVLFRQLSGWTGVTYRWNAAQTDASLLYTGVDEAFTVDGPGGPEQQTWSYPSPNGCLACHTAASGRVLGFRGPQLNHDFPYPGGVDNQLHALSCTDFFSTDLGDPAQFPAHFGVDDFGAGRAPRVRAYLDSNCAHCHQPGGPAPGGMDMRATTLLGDMSLLGVPASQGDLGLPNPDRIRPGQSAESVLFERMQSLVESVRMAPTTRVPHDSAVNLVRDWIDLDLLAPDSDHDQIPDAVDNCIAVANPGQADGDGDQIGDACDPDAAPDLIATATGALEVGLGQQVSPIGNAINVGAGISATSQIRFYLSEDMSFDPAVDPLIGDCHVQPILPSALRTCSDAQAVVPADLVVLGPGETRNFHWVGCADGFGVVFEGDESNNCSVNPQNVVVPEPGAATAIVCSVLALAGLAARRRAPRRADRTRPA